MIPSCSPLNNTSSIRIAFCYGFIFFLLRLCTKNNAVVHANPLSHEHPLFQVAQGRILGLQQKRQAEQQHRNNNNEQSGGGQKLRRTTTRSNNNNPRYTDDDDDDNKIAEQTKMCENLSEFFNHTRGIFDDILCSCDPDYNSTIGISCHLFCPICTDVGSSSSSSAAAAAGTTTIGFDENDDDEKICATMHVQENFDDQPGMIERYTETYRYTYGRDEVVELQHFDCVSSSPQQPPQPQNSNLRNPTKTIKPKTAALPWMKCSSCRLSVDDRPCNSCTPKSCHERLFGYEVDCSNLEEGMVWDTCGNEFHSWSFEQKSLITSGDYSSVFSVLNKNMFPFDGECPTTTTTTGGGGGEDEEPSSSPFFDREEDLPKKQPNRAKTGFGGDDEDQDDGGSFFSHWKPVLSSSSSSTQQHSRRDAPPLGVSSSSSSSSSLSSSSAVRNVALPKINMQEKSKPVTNHYNNTPSSSSLLSIIDDYNNNNTSSLSSSEQEEL